MSILNTPTMSSQSIPGLHVRGRKQWLPFLMKTANSWAFSWTVWGPIIFNTSILCNWLVSVSASSSFFPIFFYEPHEQWTICLNTQRFSGFLAVAREWSVVAWSVTAESNMQHWHVSVAQGFTIWPKIIVDVNIKHCTNQLRNSFRARCRHEHSRHCPFQHILQS